MFTRNPVRCLAITALAGTLAGFSMFVLAQEKGKEDEARGAYMATRPSAKSTKGKNKPKVPVDGSGGQVPSPVEGAPSGPIGLGYTVYTQSESGKAVRINPNHVFREGDALRLIVESNTDGHLYVFAAEKTGEKEGEPKMIFPQIRLDQGNNQIKAHVPYEVPSSRETEPNLRWFEFDKTQATERIYLVVSRKPIEGVPIGRDLVTYCQAQANSSDCEWRPVDRTWRDIAASAAAPKQTSVKRTDGLGQPKAEELAIARSVGLKRNEAEPWVVQMNVAASSGILVTVAELIHR